MKGSINSLEIEFCWVPSHVGIQGNEEADEAANTSASLPVAVTDIPASDYRAILRRVIKLAWQSEWDSNIYNKLHNVKPILSEWRSARHRERFYEVVLCRLRIGHTRLTHGHLLQKENEPICEHCSETLTIVHILIVCPQFEQHRRSCFSIFYREHIPFHLALLLGDEPLVPYKQVFEFLTKVDLLRKL